MKMREVPLTYPLPSREWFRTENGWTSREWTAKAKEQVKQHQYKLVPAK